MRDHEWKAIISCLLLLIIPSSLLWRSCCHSVLTWCSLLDPEATQVFFDWPGCSSGEFKEFCPCSWVHVQQHQHMYVGKCPWKPTFKTTIVSKYPISNSAVKLLRICISVHFPVENPALILCFNYRCWKKYQLYVGAPWKLRLAYFNRCMTGPSKDMAIAHPGLCCRRIKVCLIHQNNHVLHRYSIIPAQGMPQAADRERRGIP